MGGELNRSLLGCVWQESSRPAFTVMERDGSQESLRFYTRVPHSKPWCLSYSNPPGTASNLRETKKTAGRFTVTYLGTGKVRPSGVVES
eukprot:7452202-Pyramimonas_sp.AAC.2